MTFSKKAITLKFPRAMLFRSIQAASDRLHGHFANVAASCAQYPCRAKYHIAPSHAGRVQNQSLIVKSNSRKRNAADEPPTTRCRSDLPSALSSDISSCIRCIQGAQTCQYLAAVGVFGLMLMESP
jgi:hypothetical protein